MLSVFIVGLQNAPKLFAAGAWPKPHYKHLQVKKTCLHLHALAVRKGGKGTREQTESDWNGKGRE